MTDSSSNTSDENPSDSGAVHDPHEDPSTAFDGSGRSASDDAEVRELLGSLEPLAMPEAVHQRIIAALAAEPNPYSVAPSASSAPPAAVADLTTRRRNKNRWLLTAAGVAAAGVIGVSLSSSWYANDGGDAVPTAAVVPMSASGMVYDKSSLISQVSSVLPTWTAAATNYDGVVELQPPDSDLDSQAGNADSDELRDLNEFNDRGDTNTASPGPTESVMAQTKPGQDPVMVNKKVLEQVNDCVQIVDQRRPIHVDIASYRGGPSVPAEPVAVFALDGGGNKVEVYVVSVRCSRENPAMVREHVTVSAP
jgi:hypothetical protein